MINNIVSANLSDVFNSAKIFMRDTTKTPKFRRKYHNLARLNDSRLHQPKLLKCRRLAAV